MISGTWKPDNVWGGIKEGMIKMGTFNPVVPKETEGREGRQEGKPARTREAKMGLVFTQTAVDAEG